MANCSSRILLLFLYFLLALPVMAQEEEYDTIFINDPAPNPSTFPDNIDDSELPVIEIETGQGEYVWSEDGELVYRRSEGDTITVDEYIHGDEDANHDYDYQNSGVYVGFGCRLELLEESWVELATDPSKDDEPNFLAADYDRGLFVTVAIEYIGNGFDIDSKLIRDSFLEGIKEGDLVIMDVRDDSLDMEKAMLVDAYYDADGVRYRSIIIAAIRNGYLYTMGVEFDATRDYDRQVVQELHDRFQFTELMWTEDRYEDSARSDSWIWGVLVLLLLGGSLYYIAKKR